MSGEIVWLEGPERDAVIDATWRELHPGRSREAHFAFVHGNMATAWGRRHWRMPALRDEHGEIVASLSLFDLAMRLDSRRLRLAGIGALRVRPDRRSMGLGRFFLKSVHERAAEEGFDGALLYSAIGAAYYERMGYEELPVAMLLADLRDWRDVDPTGPTTSRIRPFEQADLPAVRNLYNTATSLQRLALLRDDDYWECELTRARLREELLASGVPRSRFLVGERDGRIVSYLRASLSAGGDTLIVLELGFEAGTREDVPAMIRVLLEEMSPPPRLLRAVAPSRLANLVPARRMAWKREADDVMMMKSFGSFRVPTDLDHDERLVWACDWF